MERILIAKLEENAESNIAGLIDRVRDTKYMIFIKIKDVSGAIQVSIDKNNNKEIVDALDGVIAGSFVSFTGKMVLSEYVKDGGKEFLPSNVYVYSKALELPLDNDALIDTKLDYRWLDLRTDKNMKIFQIQSFMINKMREFLINKNFTEIHTPKLIGSASESGSEVFEVKYFDRLAYLAQSPQFYKQMAMASGFDSIFEVGPVFRAENSNTNRHTTEFTGFDIEFSYINSFDDVMDLEEEMLVYMLKNVSDKYKAEIKNLFDTDILVPDKKFPRITLRKMYEIAEERYGYKIDDAAKIDSTTELEKLAYRYAMEEFNSEFIFITEFPKDKRAFYHMRDEAGVPLGYDLIWRGVEITTGAQREHRYDILKQQALEKGLADDVKFYLEFFKYGCPPHGGFGIGVDRLTMLLLNLESLKEAMFIFRGPNRLNP